MNKIQVRQQLKIYIKIFQKKVSKKPSSRKDTIREEEEEDQRKRGEQGKGGLWVCEYDSSVLHTCITMPQ